ncbi:hypothetical protein PY092_19255 [Muricauda sp. 334s03]|uniref:Uncharacterized protein n=1 Tax=Flagellimonas yonaguniensis TaxID=3031325 RepID=A0ABT5Y4D1_9FLAO|nr:hypothetical protein [[Muricauda] yonaguniensis]MDF0718306.1 hypothetical protein [[Muricauda] yonaguniensis]
MAKLEKGNGVCFVQLMNGVYELMDAHFGLIWLWVLLFDKLY